MLSNFIYLASKIFIPGDLGNPSIKTFTIISNIILELLGFCSIICLTKEFLQVVNV